MFSIAAVPFRIPTSNTRISVVLRPLQHLSFSGYLIDVLVYVRRYLIAVLICIPLVVSAVEHHFVYLLATCVSPSKNVYPSPLFMF